jgi:transcriptional regulator with XRE-family HTH domain
VLRIKFLRLSRDLRQEQIATLLGVPRPHISQIENGVRNPTADQLAALVRVFQCPADKLMEHVHDVEVSRAQ